MVTSFLITINIYYENHLDGSQIANNCLMKHIGFVHKSKFCKLELQIEDVCP